MGYAKGLQQSPVLSLRAAADIKTTLDDLHQPSTRNEIGICTTYAERVHQDHDVHSILLQYVVALKAMACMISVYSIVALIGLS